MNRLFFRRILLGIVFFSIIGNAFSCRQRIGGTNKTVIIDVQPFSGTSGELVAYTRKQMQQIYPYIELKPETPLPQSAYFPLRNRYRADSLIRFLRRQTPEGHITIGITDKDISTTKGDKPDWGVMGLGYTPGNACVVSTFRLARANMKEQLYKICIHELGHTEGLPHCPVKTCFMRDAQGHNPINEENEFCFSCRRFLVERGWKLD